MDRATTDRRRQVLRRRHLHLRRMRAGHTRRFPSARTFRGAEPYGYENDAGGFGDVVLDARKRTLTVERNDRFEDYSTTTYEV